MPGRSTFLRTLSRGGILAAALLYVAGTAIDPLLHVHAPDGRGGPTLIASGDGHPDTPEDRRAHTDAECLLCKLPGAVLPTQSSAIPGWTSTVHGHAAPAVSGYAPPAFLLPQPRGPPLA